MKLKLITSILILLSFALALSSEIYEGRCGRSEEFSEASGSFSTTQCFNSTLLKASLPGDDHSFGDSDPCKSGHCHWGHCSFSLDRPVLVMEENWFITLSMRFEAQRIQGPHVEGLIRPPILA